MSCSNSSAAAFLKAQGASRVVLARECTLAEAARIARLKGLRARIEKQYNSRKIAKMFVGELLKFFVGGEHLACKLRKGNANRRLALFKEVETDFFRRAFVRRIGPATLGKTRPQIVKVRTAVDVNRLDREIAGVGCGQPYGKAGLAGLRWSDNGDLQG